MREAWGSFTANGGSPPGGGRSSDGGGATAGAESPSAGALQFRVVEAIVDLVEGLSLQGPVLVALEDLHWADSSTLLALRWITRELTQVPLLLAATFASCPPIAGARPVP